MTIDTTPETATPVQDEQIQKVYAKDLHEKDAVLTVFRVTQKAKVNARSGKVFVTAQLVDKTGEMDARIFDRIDETEPRFDVGDFVLVKGQVISFHGKKQIVIEAIERLDPSPLDPKEFEFTKPAEQEAAAPAAVVPAAQHKEEHGSGGSTRAVAQIRQIVEGVHDQHVRALLLAILDDPAIAAALPIAPAAKGIHHAYRGGLADHLLSVIKLTVKVADHYPMADRDLLIAGALLHDIMKVQEISADKGFAYTDEGRLVGHLVMTAQKIREKTLTLPNFPPLLEQHLTHLVLSHHGQLEYGSPKLPLTLEAHIVHALDSLDSRIASWLEAMQRDPNERWTEPLRLYDRSLWKGPSPTSRGRSPVEPRRKGKPQGERRKPKGHAAAGSPQSPAPQVVPPQAPSPRPPRNAPPKSSSSSRELTFKPFSALTETVSETAPSQESNAPQQK